MFVITENYETPCIFSLIVLALDYFSHCCTTFSACILSWDKLLYLLLISVFALSCQPLCHDYFNFAIALKFVAAKILLYPGSK